MSEHIVDCLHNVFISDEEIHILRSLTAVYCKRRMLKREALPLGVELIITFILNA